MPSMFKLLSRHNLQDMRGIEAVPCGHGFFYRVCSQGGGLCLYTPDLVKALQYADQLRPERQNSFC